MAQGEISRKLEGAQHAAPPSVLLGATPLKDFCKRNRIPKTSVYRQINAGKLVVVKIGRRTYVRVADELAWLRALEPKSITA